jgi:hypothetical protein
MTMSISSDSIVSVIDSAPEAKSKKPKIEESTPEKKAYHFNPTKDESWIEEKVSFAWWQVQVYNRGIYWAIKGVVSEKSWTTHIKSLDINTLGTLGKIEEFALKIMKEEMTRTEEQKEQTHKDLKEILRSYTATGFVGSVPAIVGIIRTL